MGRIIWKDEPVSRVYDEIDCDYCGGPIMVGDPLWAVGSEVGDYSDGCYCSKGCASRWSR